MTTYTLQYPPIQNETYVKATTSYTPYFYPYYATDPTKSLIGDQASDEWISSGGVSQNRFHIDLGTPTIIRRVYYENHHNSGAETTRGAKEFTIWGSNEASSFAELTYATDTNWTQLVAGVTQFDIHISANTEDPKYFLVTNTTDYRYYCIKISSDYGGGYCGLRRIVLMTEDGYPPESGGFIPRVIIF
jgi:hypothetical protein